MRTKKNKATKKVHFESLPLIHPNAAGMEVGSKEHLVAVPPDRDPQPVRTFQAFTPDLHELAAWLKRCGIETVALESTGIYWIPNVLRFADKDGLDSDHGSGFLVSLLLLFLSSITGQMPRECFGLDRL